MHRSRRRKDHPGRLFGKWLPFIGSISFGGEPVAWARTDYPSYWLSQTYNYYSPKGWIATDTEPIEIGPDILPPPTTDTLKRETRDQVMQLGFATDKMLIGGGYNWASHSGTIESLAPEKIHNKHERYDQRRFPARRYPATGERNSPGHGGP